MKASPDGLHAERGFWPVVWSSAAPLLVWAFHFALCYVSVSLACDVHTSQDPDGSPGRAHLGLYAGLACCTVAALAAELSLCRRAVRARREGALRSVVIATTALLSVVAIAWTTVLLGMTRWCGLA